jgi:hypothetical protein
MIILEKRLMKERFCYSGINQRELLLSRYLRINLQPSVRKQRQLISQSRTVKLQKDLPKTGIAPLMRLSRLLMHGLKIDHRYSIGRRISKILLIRNIQQALFWEELEI